MNKALASLLTVLFLGGCATGGVNTNSQDFQNKFSTGEIRFSCGLACSGTFGATRPRLKKLFIDKNWTSLAKETAASGYENDLAYFYMAVAAGSLGYLNAAKTYLTLANSTNMKCDGSLNVCDGFQFPSDLNKVLVEINKAEKNISAKTQKQETNPAAKPVVNNLEQKTQSNVLKLVFDKKWSSTSFPCNHNGGAYDIYTDKNRGGQIQVVNGSVVFDGTKLNHIESRFEITGPKTFTFYERNMAKGNPRMERLMPQPGAIVGQSVTYFELASPTQLAYKSVNELIDVSLLMSTGQISYDKENESGVKTACNF